MQAQRANSKRMIFLHQNTVKITKQLQSIQKKWKLASFHIKLDESNIRHTIIAKNAIFTSHDHYYVNGRWAVHIFYFVICDLEWFFDIEIINLILKSQREKMPFSNKKMTGNFFKLFFFVHFNSVRQSIVIRSNMQFQFD